MKLNIVTSIWLSIIVMSLTCLADEYPTLKFSGNIMLDYDHFDENFLETPEDNESDSELEIRRLRLSLESDFHPDWSAKLSLDGNEGSEVKDVYVKYHGWAMADFTIGKQKEPFGLERLMSSKNLLMIERSMINSAISPGRSYGIKAAGGQNSVNWQLGYFQDDNAAKSNAITGRLTWTPWLNNKNFVHVGASFSERSLHGDDFRINQTMEVNGADSLIEGATFNADSASLTGVELLWQQNGFVSMAEWQQSKVKADDGNESLYEGGYLQLSYLFSGKNRQNENGILKGVKTKNDWEITTRYSQLKLDQENSEAKIFSAGVNYYFNKDCKLMADYINAEYVDDGDSSGSGNAISLRAQYRF